MSFNQEREIARERTSEHHYQRPRQGSRKCALLRKTKQLFSTHTHNNKNASTLNHFHPTAWASTHFLLHSHFRLNQMQRIGRNAREGTCFFDPPPPPKHSGKRTVRQRRRAVEPAPPPSPPRSSLIQMARHRSLSEKASFLFFRPHRF